MGGGLHPPPEVLFSWPVPNYVNPPERSFAVPILSITLLVVTWITVTLRFYTRLIIAKSASYDDLLIAIAMVPLTGLAITLYLAYTRYGFNRHVWDIPMPVLLSSRKVTMALEMLYLVSTTATKISVLLFYRRLASGTLTKTFLYCVYAAIAYVALYFIIFTVNLFVGCRPLDAFWKQVDPVWNAEHITEYSCFNEAWNIIAAAVISATQDILACSLPMVMFWKVRIPRRQKFALGAIFGVGYFLCVTAILRIVYMTPIYFTTYDMTWESMNAWIWFVIESHVGVICASAPALNYFFRKYLRGTTATFTKYYQKSRIKEVSDSSQPSVGSDGRAITRDEKEAPCPNTMRMDEFMNDKRYDLQYVDGPLRTQDDTLFERYEMKQYRRNLEPPKESQDGLSQSWLKDETSGSERSSPRTEWSLRDVEMGAIQHPLPAFDTLPRSYRQFSEYPL